MFCAIWCHLHKFNNVENNHGGVLLLVKFQAFNQQLGCFSRFKLYKCYQIVQRIIHFISRLGFIWFLNFILLPGTCGIFSTWWLFLSFIVYTFVVKNSSGFFNQIIVTTTSSMKVENNLDPPTLNTFQVCLWPLYPGQILTEALSGSPQTSKMETFLQHWSTATCRWLLLQSFTSYLCDVYGVMGTLYESSYSRVCFFACLTLVIWTWLHLASVELGVDRN